MMPDIADLQRRLEALEKATAAIPGRERSRGGAAAAGGASILTVTGGAFIAGLMYYPNDAALVSPSFDLRGAAIHWTLWDGKWRGGVYPALALDAERLLIQGTATLTLAGQWGVSGGYIEANFRIGIDSTFAYQPRLLNYDMTPICLGICLSKTGFVYEVAWHPVLFPAYSNDMQVANTEFQWLDVEACEGGAQKTYRILMMDVTGL